MTSAVVLGGGGIAGVAWEAGIVIGLQRAGVDLRSADIIIGTSAGSIVGSHLASAAGPEALAALPSTSAEADRAAAAAVDFDDIMNALAPAFDPALDPAEARRRIGAAARAAAAGDETSHIARIASLLPSGGDWPERLLVTGVDAGSGEPVVWDRSSSVPLERAVAASCAVPGAYPPVTIGGRRYMDGGVRSVTNADLAADASAVIVLDAVGHLTSREQLQAELATLGAGRTMVIIPDEGAAAAMGINLLDAAVWPAAFDAGLAQAASCAQTARATWTASR